MQAALTNMKAVAKTYCELIETIDPNAPDWLRELSRLLPRVHAAVKALGAPECGEGFALAANLDLRFELYSRLHRLLGELDAYWMEFDVAVDGQHKSGSLADDLTDIYCELKHGLCLLQSAPDCPDQALNGWRQSYRLHWGQHLVDAERHLYELDTRNLI